ncbi:MAG: polyphosphate polymerase domain-containing protein [Lachnospiraceae bacterium]|nr:polyphosphate polymerase domain-containing protein [Lachnospiraceae bacterium]
MGEYREVFQRKEIKYLLDDEQYRELKKYLDTMAQTDQYGLSRINNIYFDTKDYRLIRTSMDKPLYKEKLRLRTYGDTADDTNAFIEIKKKYAGIVYKRRISGRYEKMHAYLTRRDSDIGSSQIAKEIDSFLKLYGELIPAMSICYERMAMAGIQDPEFRVTFDSNIEWNANCRDLRKIGKGRMLLQPGQYLMEIKVSNAMTVGLAKKLSELKVFPTSFSKYGAGYADMIRSAATVKAAAIKETTGFAGRMKGEVSYV